MSQCLKHAQDLAQSIYYKAACLGCVSCKNHKLRHMNCFSGAGGFDQFPHHYQPTLSTHSLPSPRTPNCWTPHPCGLKPHQSSPLLPPPSHLPLLSSHRAPPTSAIHRRPTTCSQQQPWQIVSSCGMFVQTGKAQQNNMPVLKALDTFGTCVVVKDQSSHCGVFEHMYTITNLWKFGLDWSSKLPENNRKKTLLHILICVLSDA